MYRIGTLLEMVRCDLPAAHPDCCAVTGLASATHSDSQSSCSMIPTALVMPQVRTMAVTLAQDGKSVKVCVQEAMGAGVFQGLPLSLSGVKRCATLQWTAGSVTSLVPL